ncbi:glyceraldehyde-3-phosphate dehydrogenase, type II [Methanocaldococcus vulcanius M7]|uniref:Glyceraldehyde-3-phosphate dehydrogenase n=1 Tax=Methanocaldococcus vulcanius (strain ATCC 700851 / DSM 12094 / M7) TaxID=579137 RepID=C9RFA1_METVM|nr:type II glyceraldehyde-3-phosphate dehydrogenase [Methanocaldococcus vulcanius]ACX72253.1 glyceraldehyde-3-phosphate dehydrogenase, type II [Methanocaldococcus vulcanius M7]
MSAKVLINGYGSIGKRVADAVAVQDDMEVIGVSKTKPDFEARLAVEKGYKLFVAVPDRERIKLFEEAGIPVEGTILDVIEEADIVVDGAPKKIGKQNLENIYKPNKVKAILQGGEKAKDVEDSFNALWSFDRCYGKDYIRVVSCNTTGLCRILYAINEVSNIKKARVVLVRRAADPNDDKTGPINAITPNPVTVPSHHGPDVVSVVPELEGKILTSAVIVPTTLMHQHTLMVEVDDNISREDVLDSILKTPRIITVKAEDGFTSTAKIIEYGRDIGRLRYDINELVIWEESVNVLDREIFLMQAVHQESIVVPENIDCIRAMLQMEDDKFKSIEKTNKAMGIK